MHVQRILVPVDGSELSERAIEASVALAAQLRAAIVGFIAQPKGRAPAGRRLTGLLDNDPPDPEALSDSGAQAVGSSRVDLQACKLEYSIVSPK